MSNPINTPLAATQAWLKSTVIAYNLCPFAGQTLARNRIRFVCQDDSALETCLLHLMDECERLDSDDSIETTLLVYSTAFKDFEDYLDYLAYAEALLAEQGYVGIYQLASFHPDYCFEGSTQDDPANYTNRSPYPMLHLLREDSIAKVVANFPQPENIPEQNVALTRKLGLAKLRDLLAACY